MSTETVRHRKTKTKDTTGGGAGDGHTAILFNCSCHDFDTVIDQLRYAVPCSYAVARRFAYVTHETGQATVFSGSQEECDSVADKLAEIGLKVRVT